jgi:hypothetical protein
MTTCYFVAIEYKNVAVSERPDNHLQDLLGHKIAFFA